MCEACFRCGLPCFTPSFGCAWCGLDAPAGPVAERPLKVRAVLPMGTRPAVMVPAVEPFLLDSSLRRRQLDRAGRVSTMLGMVRFSRQVGWYLLLSPNAGSSDVTLAGYPLSRPALPYRIWHPVRLDVSGFLLDFLPSAQPDQRRHDFQDSPTGRVRDERFRNLALEIIQDVADPLGQVKAVHDWLILHTAYDYDNYLANQIPEDSYRPSRVLATGRAVCSGYSRVAKELLCSLGIETITVCSPDHEWNMVRLYGSWYHMDVTWDDPVPDRPGQVRYEHFLVSEAKIRSLRSHSLAAASPPAPVDYPLPFSRCQAHVVGRA